MNSKDYQSTKKNASLAVALVCAILAAKNIFDQPLERPSGGRWGWFFGLIWDYFGPYGAFFYWSLLFVVFLFCFFRIKK